MRQKKILCIGNAVLDQLFFMNSMPHRAGKFFAESFLEAGGGPAATAAVTIVKLGCYARLWSRIGEDSIGDRIVSELQGFGVDMTGLERLKGVCSSFASVVVDKKGERMIIGYVDPNLPKNADGLPLEQVKDFDCVLADVRWLKGAEAVLEEAKKHNVPTVLDADLCPDVEALQRLVPLARHVVFSEGGLKQYSGVKELEVGLHLAAKLAPNSTHYVTLGHRGCLWIENNQINAYPAFRVDIVDTTGAGDVFHGAFAVGIAEGMSAQEIIRFAAATAALKCTKAGGRAGIPDRASLNSFLQDKNI
ncbi:PfkB family carbohydrate kinase [Desulfovibrio litoralis]|uniref:Sulfofructose kinase n=1 Tax=Desulfovibrio litoralis DSM 11393 TaxID=1121455 RepID=A0A1M7TBX2_9BACT|nr:PfkB family carbohydrate kinase [Desulfovibrio litoralis]SHN68186.1 sulfofructose kinase [Desulfovibrio litoralis DSM 11393]